MDLLWRELTASGIGWLFAHLADVDWVALLLGHLLAFLLGHLAALFTRNVLASLLRNLVIKQKEHRVLALAFYKYKLLVVALA